MVGSSFVTDATDSLDAMINAAAKELHDLLIEKFGSDYKVSSSSFNTSAGVSTVALPSDFYKLLGVDLTINGFVHTLEKFNFRDRNALKNLGAYTPTTPPLYRLEGSNLRLYPAPNSTYAGVIWYVPVQADLTSGGGSPVSLDMVNGYEEYVVLRAAIMALAKEESSTGALESQLALQIQRIERAAENRDAGAVHQATDVMLPDTPELW